MRRTILDEEELKSLLTNLLIDEARPIEIFSAAGLLARHIGVDDYSRGLLLTSRARTPAFQDFFEETVDVISEIATFVGGEPLEEKVAAILLVDELCAAAWFLGNCTPLLTEITTLCEIISQFPQDYYVLAPMAQRILGNAPPQEGDHAILMWEELAKLVH